MVKVRIRVRTRVGVRVRVRVRIRVRVTVRVRVMVRVMVRVRVRVRAIIGIRVRAGHSRFQQRMPAHAPSWPLMAPCLAPRDPTAQLPGDRGLCPWPPPRTNG